MDPELWLGHDSSLIFKLWQFQRMSSTLTTVSSPAPLVLLTLLPCMKTFVPLFMSPSGVILPLFNFSLSLYGCHNSSWYSRAVVTLSITHLQAILEPVDGPWGTRSIVSMVGLSTRPFIQEHKSPSQAACKLAALPSQCPPWSWAVERKESMQMKCGGTDRKRCAVGGSQKLNLSSFECQWK